MPQGIEPIGTGLAYARGKACLEPLVSKEAKTELAEVGRSATVVERVRKSACVHSVCHHFKHRNSPKYGAKILAYRKGSNPPDAGPALSITDRQ